MSLKKNVDLVIFGEALRLGPNCYETDRFIAFEIKCNINLFIKSIANSLEKGREINSIKNYTKLLYLKDMTIQLQEISKVIICTLSEISEFSKMFLENHQFNCIEIWEPLQ